MRPLLITANLASPLAGDPPQLDGLLEWCLTQSLGTVVTRDAAPAQDATPIPIQQEWIGAWLVSRVSNPVMLSVAESVEHFAKRFSAENASLLHERERGNMQTVRGVYKSYRLPLRVRVVSCIRWACIGDEDAILEPLQRLCPVIGKKRSIGYGRVAAWEAEALDDDYSWFAPSDVGPVLMRTLPVGDWLPPNLVGSRRDFAPCRPPYWHPDRNCEVVVPC